MTHRRSRRGRRHRDGDGNGRRHRECWGNFAQRRSSRYRSRPASLGRDDEQHSRESLLRVLLQCGRCAGRGGRSLSVLRPPAVADDSCRRYGAFVGQRDRRFLALAADEYCTCAQNRDAACFHLKPDMDVMDRSGVSDHEGSERGIRHLGVAAVSSKSFLPRRIG